MADIVEQAIKIAEEAMAHPLMLPILVGISTVLFTVVLFFSISSKAGKKQKKRRESKSDAGVGTTTVDGVRRSTRAAKTSSKVSGEEFVASPAPRKTPAKKVPETPKEATTVTPKRRGRPAKSPAPTEAVATTPRRRGRPRKSA